MRFMRPNVFGALQIGSSSSPRVCDNKNFAQATIKSSIECTLKECVCAVHHKYPQGIRPLKVEGA